MNESTQLPATATPATKKGEETRDRILAAATDLIHQRGFKSTGVADILAASGVPRGSFYFYFASKEELGCVLLARYRERQREALEQAFPLDAPVATTILAFFERSARAQAEGGCKSGCLLGNLAAEITDENEDMRRELAGVLQDVQQAMAGAFGAGQERGELSADFAPGAAADFVLSVFEGSILLAKARRDPRALEASVTMLARYLETLSWRAGSQAPTGKEGPA
ncbi:MAG: TetR family transcriptional regulator C-terminal domain-containing protein [Candidatus Eisenbacteria bacterium]